jgi:hypothetical protein
VGLAKLPTIVPSYIAGFVRRVIESDSKCGRFVDSEDRFTREEEYPGGQASSRGASRGVLAREKGNFRVLVRRRKPGKYLCKSWEQPFKIFAKVQVKSWER